ncbi:MAG: non-heme iron oxygenase ferredoxin subunit [Deltaproteobacteria bacterium RBG_13_65_10]|jgi:NAD(P)H-dependent nitrite reductase small subunit|nr:MAG: non-heme iron oxygenase ferredoxin subunit [Deltaproteobacteria bacterium RBG_13_65_10]
MAFVRVAEVGAIKNGEGISVEIEGKPIAVFHCDGRIYATDNTCPHRGGPLGEGLVDGTVVTCPWHGWEYDVTSGKCLTNPKARIRIYPVKVEGNDVLLDADERRGGC